MEIVETMNTLIQEKHNHSESCIKLRLPRRTQKFDVYHAIESCCLVFFIKDLGHFFGSKVGNEFIVILREKCPHKPDFAYGIVLKHHLNVYTNLIEYIIVVYTKAAMPSFYFKARSWRLYIY